MSNTNKTMVERLEESGYDLLSDVIDGYKDNHNEALTDAEVEVIINKMNPIDVIKLWLEYNGIVGYERRIQALVEAAEGNN